MHHDPVLSSARTPFCSFGHVWVVLALWVPVPMGGSRGFALPLLFRLYVGSQRGGPKDAPGRPRRGTRQQAAEQAHAAHPRPTKLALARELLALVAGWAEGRAVYAVVDRAYAARPLLDSRPANVHVLSRLRPDAALWARPGRRRPGQRGRPRKRGHRLPTPKAMAATRRRWDPLPLTLYGRQVTPLVVGCTALWDGALRDHPVRIVIVSDPSGRRRDEAFFCTDLSVDHAFILVGDARRWTSENDYQRVMGRETPAGRAGARAVLAVPVVHSDRLVGSLSISQISSGRRFQPSDARRLEKLASAAATVISGMSRQQAAGARLATGEAAHLLNNSLTVTMGSLDMVRQADDLSPSLAPLVDTALDGLTRAVDHLARLQRVQRVETCDGPLGPRLDLARSAG